MDFTQETATRARPFLSDLLVGEGHQTSDVLIGNSQTIAEGSVLGYNTDNDDWEAYSAAAVGTTQSGDIAIAVEGVTTGGAETATIAAVIGGPVKLSELDSAPATFKKGQVKGLLILR